MERETGFEPATSTLARSHSTTELLPPVSTRETYGTTGFETASRQAQPLCLDGETPIESDERNS